MRSALTVFTFAIVSMFFSVSAHAVTFDWSYTGAGVNVGSGTFDAISQGSGRFLVDAIAGTANGQTITGLTNYAGQNQDIYTTSLNLDNGGVAFTVTGDLAYNFYYWVTAGGVGGYDCGVTGYCLIGPGTPGTSGVGPQDTTAPIDFSLTEVSATPLPPALPMFAAALVAFGAFAWRRRREERA